VHCFGKSLIQKSVFLIKKIDHDKYIFLYLKWVHVHISCEKNVYLTLAIHTLRIKVFFQNTQKKKRYECMINCIHLGHVCHLVYANNFYTCIEVKPLSHGGRRGQDHMVVGFTTTYAIKCLSPLTL
jgi:hypothetical protein